MNLPFTYFLPKSLQSLFLKKKQEDVKKLQNKKQKQKDKEKGNLPLIFRI